MAGCEWMSAIGLLLVAYVAEGQVAIEPRRPAPSQRAAEPSIRTDSNLVLVPVTVFDALNRPITGLAKENFRLFDERVEQAITHFSSEDEPLAIGIVFDVSGSMGDNLKYSRIAARTFFKTSNPEDEFCLVVFDDSPKLLIPLTANLGEIQNELVFTKSSGSTALVDAVVLGLHELKKTKKRRKALLVISDGGENNSAYSVREIRDLVRESDTLIYAIEIVTQTLHGDVLERITSESGGRVLPSDMNDVITRVGIELRNRYVLGFSPSNVTRDGRYHSLQLRLVAPRGLEGLRAEWRRGYYAPEN